MRDIKKLRKDFGAGALVVPCQCICYCTCNSSDSFYSPYVDRSGVASDNRLLGI